MGDKDGFLKYNRELPEKRPVNERLKDYKEIYKDNPEENVLKQANRCMDCGIPFCHSGCPLGNLIPDFNEAVHNKSWKKAYDILSDTNNFPEFTGRICPAPCEAACVLGINSDPVTIEDIEKNIIEKAFKNDWVKPFAPNQKTGKKVAVVGSGPAGLAAAVQLRKTGHEVTVFERNDKIGGLLRYGIPDFKLEKWVIDRRLEIMEESGVEFKVNANVGVNVSTDLLLSEFDAILLAGGCTVPRDLNIKGRNSSGIHFAMEYLEQKNREVAGQKLSQSEKISAKGKHAVVIGGGDTGSDCVGTANREKAKSITQIELLSKPPLSRTEASPWPLWPMILRTSSSHEEGGDRKWAIHTKEFLKNQKNELTGLKISDIAWEKNDKTGQNSFSEIEGSERIIPCNLALLAVGFIKPETNGMLADFGIKLDQRGNVHTQNFQTNVPKIFAAGDIKRGQSLVVWAISEGREAAKAIDTFLMGKNSSLEAKDISVYQSSTL